MSKKRRAAGSNPFNDIATQAAVIVEGYPAAARSLQNCYRQIQDTLNYLSLHSDDDPPPSLYETLPGHVEELRVLGRQDELRCRDYRSRLARLAHLVFVHQPTLANDWPVIELVPPFWHDRPLAEWSELLKALRAIEVAAVQAIAGPAAETATPPSTETNVPLLALLGPDARQIAMIAGDATKPASERMALIIALDRSFAGKDSIWWADILQVNAATIRQADTWKTIQAGRATE